MSKQEIQEELKQVFRLLHIEKEEDHKQYKQKMQSTSFDERRKTGVCWYPVRIEKSSFSSAERLMVKVSRRPEHRDSHLFQSGKLVSFFSNARDNDEDNESVNGVVNMVRDHEMLITLNADDEPDWIFDGKLGVQLLFDENAYKEMERALIKVTSAENNRLVELRQIILGNQTVLFTEANSIKVHELNESQNNALNKTLSANDISIIHGPPGTGKTTTLIQAIIHTLKKETQILVCAPSNAAVDLIAEKLGEYTIDVVRIGHPARVNDEILSKTLDAKVSKHSRYKELKSLKKSASEYHSLAHRYKRNFGPAEREQRRLLFTEAKRFTAEANLLHDYIREDILHKTRVIATTLVGANNPAIQKMHFPVVFIDEAAQGLEPASWIPIIKADKVVFAGDHCQLPPTIKSFEAAQGGLSSTLFEKAIQRNDADVMLAEQYRMNSQIMDFSNRVFYKNELQANSKVKDWLIFPEDLPLEFIDTAGCGFYEQFNKKNKSAFNPEEMNLLFRHLNKYLESIHTLKLLDSIDRIGIISPYKAQVSQMQEHFEKNHPLADEFKSLVSINTIDSFQGQERDIIYISLVRSNEKSEIGFLSDTRRMNVAMTRARKKLVIIGDSATIGNHSFYNEFLDYVNEIGAYKSAFEYLY